jgi:hypothetical protein
LCSILEKDKLNGTNYSKWVYNLRLVLMSYKKETPLDTPIHADNATSALKMPTRKHVMNLLRLVVLFLHSWNLVFKSSLRIRKRMI